MPSVVPWDIVEQIIHDISRNIKALRTCALVNRDWYAACKPLLHSRLKYRGTKKCKERLEFYTSHPDLLECIAELDIKIIWKKRLTEYAPLHTTQFPGLTTLCIVGNGCDDDFQYIKNYEQSHGLKSLSISVFVFPKGTFIPFILSSPLLSSLSLEDVEESSNQQISAQKNDDDKAGYKDTGVVKRSVLSRLRRLQVDSCDASIALVKHILNLSRSLPIEHVGISFERMGYPLSFDQEFKYAEDLCKTVSRTLRTVSIQDHWSDARTFSDSDLRPLRLSKCRQIRTFEVVFCSSKGDHLPVEYISSLSFDTLEEIIIRFTYPSVLVGKHIYEDKCTATYTTLDAFLVKKKKAHGDAFPMVTISISAKHRLRSSVSNIMTTLSRILPQSTAMGLIRVRYMGRKLHA